MDLSNSRLLSLKQNKEGNLKGVTYSPHFYTEGAGINSNNDGGLTSSIKNSSMGKTLTAIDHFTIEQCKIVL